MKRRWLATTMVVAVFLLAATARATIIYQDFFDRDTLGHNDAPGGGMESNSIQNHYWIDDGDLSYKTSGTQFQRRALVYSTNAWQSASGFTLVVFHTSSGIAGFAGCQFSFGLVNTNTDLSAYSEYNIFGTETNVYSIGANLTLNPSGGLFQGLNFADGSSVTNLDVSGDNVQFVAGASTPVVISVLPDGSGGADWSYSINGTQEASGNIASFDFTGSYRFAVYGQDDDYSHSIQSVTLYAGPGAGENLVPIALAQSTKTFPGMPVEITLVGIDPEGSSLTYTVVDSPANGTLEGTAPNLSYTPMVGYQGEDSFTFQVNDGVDDSATASISITVTNLVPTALAQELTTAYKTPVAIMLNGSDLDGPSNLTYRVEVYPANGVLSGTAPDLTYTPAAGFDGVDSFTYTVNDGLAESDPATVSIAVSPYGVNLSFKTLSSALSGNTLKIGGSTNNVVVSGVASGDSYIYSVTYTGADYDGDAVNDTLAFDVLVEGWSGSTVSTTFESSESDVNAFKGSATIGTTASAVTLNTDGWAVGGNTLGAGLTLEYTLQNFSVVTTLSGTYKASLTRFTGTSYRETGNSYGHLAVIGEGASGLFATRFNATNYKINNLLNEDNPLYISSAAPGGLPSSNYQRWNVLDIDFDVNVRPAQGSVILLR